MIQLPKAAEPLLNGFSLAFTARTFDRWLRLCVAAIITIGPRTVTNMIWSARVIMPGHFSTCHRLFSVIALMFAQQHQRIRKRSTSAWQRSWLEKNEPIFADALANVRILFWQETIMCNPVENKDAEMKSASLTSWLLSELCRAA